MITDILKYRIAAINKEYKQILDSIRRKENKIRELVIEQLHLENQINELDRRLEELEIESIRDIEHAARVDRKDTGKTS